MAALVVGLAFGFALTLGGAGWVRHFDPDELPLPLAVAGILAIFVVVAGDVAALFRYSFWAVVVLAILLLCGGWMWPAKSNLRELRVGTDYTPHLILLLAITALALATPLLLLPVPLDTDAQGFGYLSLMIREGHTINSLTPWHPEISYLYSPGALLVFATLSGIFVKAPMSAVMMGASHAVTFLFVWLAGESGRAIGKHSKQWAAAMTFSAALSVGLWTALMDSHYTAIFALLFALAFITSLFRFLRTGSRTDLTMMVIQLAAVFATHPDTVYILMLALASFFLLSWVAVERPSIKRWLLVSIATPAAAAILVLPWLIHIWPLVRSGIESPFQGWLAGWRVSVLYHGLVWPALALLGAGLYLRTRQLWVLMMVGWLVFSLELSTFGLPGRSLPALFRFNYPFSVAWHAPTIPYMVLGAGFLVWVMEKSDFRFVRGLLFPAAITAAMLLLLALMFPRQLLAFSKGHLKLYGAFATANDVRAMRWVRDHAAADARVLNYPGDYDHLRDWETHWAPVLCERDCVYFRAQPFFCNCYNISRYVEEQRELLSFWIDPSNIANAARLHAAHIDYVLVPESVGDPESFKNSWRWQPPALLPNANSTPKDASYLRLVFQLGGAQVYEVRP